MKKIYFFFLLLILTTLSSKHTSELKANPSDLGCTSEISENYLINYNNLKINKLKILKSSILNKFFSVKSTSANT